jgi:ankyrin repeat protein
MFRYTSGSNTITTTSTINNKSEDDIIFAIVTHNITNLKRLVNSDNVNKIIDNKNKYTALHHAVRIKKNDDIIEYLLSIGANPKLKQDEGKDAIDLAIEANYRFLIDKLFIDKENELDLIFNKFDNSNYKIKILENKNQELVKTNEYLTKSNTQYANKIEELKIENTGLKRKYEDSEKAFSNLLKKQKK